IPKASSHRQEMRRYWGLWRANVPCRVHVCAGTPAQTWSAYSPNSFRCHQPRRAGRSRSGAGAEAGAGGTACSSSVSAGRSTEEETVSPEGGGASDGSGADVASELLSLPDPAGMSAVSALAATLSSLAAVMLDKV